MALYVKIYLVFIEVLID